MNIKVKNTTLEYALSRPLPKRKPLKKPSLLFRTLVRLLSIPDLVATKFKYTTHRLEEAGKGPYLILMNHSSFIDLKIASKILYPTPYFIVSTSDSFVGKEWLMRELGCIPTRKFTNDVPLMRDMVTALRDKKTSVLLYPEAGYSFDGRATPLPRKLGQMLKRLNVPVLSIITDGAFLRQPLYNDLKLRKVEITAKFSCLLTKQEIAEKSVDELDEMIDNAFSFDNFKSQLQNGKIVSEPFRAQGLHRVLYRCPHCQTEGQMLGEGETLTCKRCGVSYHMDTLGTLENVDGESKFTHIPKWYEWQRECVKKEIIDGTYGMELDVDIILLRDYKALYAVGEGKLTHGEDGFTLTGCEGKLQCKQSVLSSYGLNADYNWYELGDIICIADKEALYYCIPKQEGVVTKARFAAEELYKLKKQALSEQ